MKMNKMRIAAVLAFVAAAVGVWSYSRAEASDTPVFRFATVERGNVSATVSATGALGAVRTVQVGTQVSGKVDAIYADFNDRVKKGQLLARIDPTLQQQTVQDAQAQLERAQAQLAQSEAEYDRNKTLYDAKIVTASEFGSVRANFAVAKANVKSANVTLQRARQNLSYTAIYSPIDGIIVERNVDVGQTVAASLSAPQLFLIANDLTEMQILASVDESDIGQIKEAQPVKFNVQSYPNQTFDGAVRQVRLQSKTQDNVVNYSVVVGVKNSGRLLPGMTATLQFVTGSADSVLTVPNAALRYRPTAEQLIEAGITDSMPTGRARGDSARRAGGGGAGAQQGGGFGGGFPQGGGFQGGGGANAGGRQRGQGGGMGGGGGTLYYMKDGKLASMRVRTGLSDGSKTQVMSRDSTLKEGLRIITGAGVATTQPANAQAPGATASPFQPGGQQRRPGGF
jgi:HlyD family secretion protein